MTQRTASFKWLITMQKFGLDNVLAKTQKFDEFQELELQLLKEHSSALGRAGKKLDDAINVYQQQQSQHLTPQQTHIFLTSIAQNLHTLMIQRELTGFTDSNLSTIRKYYDIPEAAIKLLGTVA